MKAIASIAILLQALAVRGARIVQSNDDGWAELYLRSFNDALNAAGHSVVLSAPADNKSGSGSRDEPPTPRVEPCQYDSCPPDSGPVGYNASRPDLNWVNSFPVTSMRYAIDTFAPRLWGPGNAPDLAVAGPNVGSNLFLAVQLSGTVGAAAYAAREARIPSVAFSGASTGTLPWDASPVPLRSSLYADLATNLTDKLLASGKPYLPDGVFLNVNFPRVEGACTDPSAFTWVLSRINPALGSPAPDVDWCGSRLLPTELSVFARRGCHISVSVGDANDKTTASAEKQAVVLDKLRDILTCLPSQ